MAADERIKVIFTSVFVRDDSDTFGSGEFKFQARVGAQAVGDVSRVFDAVEGRTIVLPQPQWSGIINVAGLDEVVVSFHTRESDVFSDDELGTIRHTLRRPYQQAQLRHGSAFLLLDWEVQLAVDGNFGRHPPSSVFACRQHAGSITCTTVSGASFDARMEFHPVRPVPRIPPPSSLPVRPPMPLGTVPDTNDLNTLVSAGDPINIIPNPAVVPLLGPPAAAPPGPHTDAELDAGNWANLRNCARLEYSFYVPAGLAFTDNDARLEWSVVSVAGGGAAAFFGAASGRKVMVFGTAAGEVRFEVRFKGALFATYRALVSNLRRLPCRCNIHNGNTPDSVPRATPADVKNHIDIANRFMRQLGLELTLDTNPTVTHGARLTGIPGIFRLSVARGQTRNLSIPGQERAAIKNHRVGVMNFAYIHSDNRGILGAGIDFPNSTAPAAPGARPQITDNGSPSTSWIRPTGVGIGADATVGPVVMQLIGGRPRAGHPQLFSMVVTDANGGALLPAGNHATLARQREYANTISHEFGHVLSLGHRVEGVPAAGANPARDQIAADPPATLNAGGIFWDGLLHPPHENVMQWQDPSTIAQDFDIIQARGVLFSPLVVGAVPLPPGVVVPPPPPRSAGTEYVIQSGEWLGQIAGRYSLTAQELYAYDGNTGRPNRERLRSGDINLIFAGEVIVVPGAP
ncbi:MAG: LysM domain-containing protein [Rhodanobacter sp.]